MIAEQKSRVLVQDWEDLYYEKRWIDICC
jgi:hypothetical protein